jgi:Abnormal spindle-like microcephaly-assoc'd, ASPM-SPD-2-Hydin
VGDLRQRQGRPFGERPREFTVAIVSDASNPTLNIPLTGTAVAPGLLAANPSSESFGSIADGSNNGQSVTLNNSAGSSVTISRATATGSGFSLSGRNLPLALNAGQSKTSSVTFTPASAATVSGSILITLNASNPSLTISLSGTGTGTTVSGQLTVTSPTINFGNVVPQHSVALSRNASTSVVVGYNVYRGTQTGGPYSKISTVLQASTNYTDATVQGGQTYYYVTTAVNANSVESGYSNEARAVIPFP